MKNVYKISIYRGCKFKTNNEETLKRYQRRQENATRTPIRITKLKKESKND